MSDVRAQDWMRHITRAAGGIDPRLTDGDVARLIDGAHQRRRRRKLRRACAVAFAIGAAAAATATIYLRPLPASRSTAAETVEAPRAEAERAPSVWAASRDPFSSPAASQDPSSSPASPPRALRLEDGSEAIPIDPASDLRLIDQTPHRTLLELGRGRGRFDVAPRPERSFSVQAGDVTVTVVGTVFTVERVADRVGVVVERGTVRVEWENGTRYLRSGESGWFPPLFVRPELPLRPELPSPTSAAEPRSPTSAAEPPSPTSAAEPPSPTSAPEPRSPTSAAEPRSPTSAPELGGVDPVPSGASPAITSTPRPTRGGGTREAPGAAGDLLSAADAARLAGRTEEGVALLRRLLREHGTDPRAPLAAFTLGRALLVDLGRPREAALAFAHARALAPAGAFAEDSLAREVEAWSQAGEADQATERAREYVRRYPNGRRVDAVKTLGRIE